MAATEVTVPTLTSVIVDAIAYRNRYRPHAADSVDGAYGSSTLQVTNSADVNVNIANGGAVVQGVRYDLTGGPMVLPVDPNTRTANRFDIIALTYDSSHSPAVYLRTIKGTAGAGLPALTNVGTGVWDFPLAHYEKQQNGSLVNLRDRRKFSDNEGGTVCGDDTTGTSGVGWFPPAPVNGQVQRFLPSGNAYIWKTNAWVLSQSGGVTTPVQVIETTGQTTTSQTYGLGSPLVNATMICPPSGKIVIHLQMRASTAGNDMTCYGSFRLRLTDANGTIILDPDYDRACWTADPDVTSAAFRYIVTGLIPAQAYYVEFMHRSGTGDSITVSLRQILLEPVK